MKSEVSGILVAAHELKAPLCLVRQLALSLDLAQTESARAQLQSRLVDVSERALRQVEDLSKLARLEDGLFVMEPVSVRGACDAVLREITPLFQCEQCQLRTTYTNKSRLALANRDLLRSVIYNFCINAIHYADTATTCQVTVADHAGAIRIGVRDYGPALPTSVWRELRRGWLDRPTSIAMRPGSSGLGLYIASQFAKHMRAELGAVRHRDGTSFFIDLPISRQASLW